MCIRTRLIHTQTYCQHGTWFSGSFLTLASMWILSFLINILVQWSWMQRGALLVDRAHTCSNVDTHWPWKRARRGHGWVVPISMLLFTHNPFTIYWSIQCQWLGPWCLTVICGISGHYVLHVEYNCWLIMKYYYYNENKVLTYFFSLITDVGCGEV